MSRRSIFPNSLVTDAVIFIQQLKLNSRRKQRKTYLSLGTDFAQTIDVTINGRLSYGS